MRAFRAWRVILPEEVSRQLVDLRAQDQQEQVHLGLDAPRPRPCTSHLPLAHRRPLRQGRAAGAPCIPTSK